MPQQIVFPCPSCGASLSADEGSARVQCQFCGNTAQVPGSMGGGAGQPFPAAQPYAAAQPDADAAAPQSVAYHDRMGRPAMLNYAEFKVIADAVRAGDKVQAVALFQQMFHVSQAEAQKNIDTLASGQEISIGTAASGGPMWLGVAKVAPAAPIVYSDGGMPNIGGAFNSPAMPNALGSSYPNSPILMSPPVNTSSGLFRLNMIATGCGILVAVVFGCGLPIVLAVPSFLPTLTHLWTQLTGR